MKFRVKNCPFYERYQKIVSLNCELVPLNQEKVKSKYVLQVIQCRMALLKSIVLPLRKIPLQWMSEISTFKNQTCVCPDFGQKNGPKSRIGTL